MFDAIGEIGPLHCEVATTGEEYSFIDQEAVRTVIEKHGVAPDEYITRIQSADNSMFLVRLVFPENFDHHQAGAALTSARAAISLGAKMIRSSGGAESASDLMCDIKFTVGFLDSLRIGAFLTDHEGAVIGYNPTTLTIFNETQLEGNYRDAFKSIVEYNPPHVEKQIVDHIATPEGSEGHYSDLAINIKTSPIEHARLIVMKLGDSPNDLSSCFVFIPGFQPADSMSAGTVDWKMWQAVLSNLGKSLKSVSFTANQVCHEFYNELGENGNHCLQKIDGAVSGMRDVVRRLSGFVRQIKTNDSVQVVDLNLLFNQQMQRVLALYPGVAVNCTYKNMPKMKTLPRVLGAAIYNVLCNSVVYNDKDKINIKIKAEVSDERCTIDIADNGVGIASRNIPRLCDFFYRVPDKNIQNIQGLGLGLALTKKLIETLSGEIDITSTEGEGTLVRISIPVQ